MMAVLESVVPDNAHLGPHVRVRIKPLSNEIIPEEVGRVVIVPPLSIEQILSRPSLTNAKNWIMCIY